MSSKVTDKSKAFSHYGTWEGTVCCHCSKLSAPFHGECDETRKTAERTGVHAQEICTDPISPNSDLQNHYTLDGLLFYACVCRFCLPGCSMCDALFTTVPTARTNAALLTSGGERHNYILIGLQTGRYAWRPHVPLIMLCMLVRLRHGE